MSDKKISLVLASFFEPHFHGKGRKIGVAPRKPANVECDLVFDPLSPTADDYFTYHKNKHDGPEAGEKFVEAYKTQLGNFCMQVSKDAKKQGKDITELLPFKDGDTLLSWERKGSVTYRKHLAEYLRDLGYDVIEN